jgi:hypothetical protein
MVGGVVFPAGWCFFGLDLLVLLPKTCFPAVSLAGLAGANASFCHLGSGGCQVPSTSHNRTQSLLFITLKIILD